MDNKPENNMHVSVRFLREWKVFEAASTPEPEQPATPSSLQTSSPIQRLFRQSARKSLLDNGFRPAVNNGSAPPKSANTSMANAPMTKTMPPALTRHSRDTKYQ